MRYFLLVKNYDMANVWILLFHRVPKWMMELHQVKKIFLYYRYLSQHPPHSHNRHIQFTIRMAHRFLRTAKKRLSLSFHTFFWQMRTSWAFPFTKVVLCLKLLTPSPNAFGRWRFTLKLSPDVPLNRNNLFMLRKMQYTKRFLLRSRHFFLATSRTKREKREWDCAYDRNLNTFCFVPSGKHTSAYISKVVMAAWNRANNVGTRCT
jgi:hypothetical protein